MKLNETKSFLRIPVIYGIKNIITNKWYIGSCLDMKDRFQRHRYYLNHNLHHSNKLQRSFNKYGENSFEIEIIKFLSQEEDLKNRFTIEEHYIKKYNSVDNGYNMTDKCNTIDGFKLSEVALVNLKTYLIKRQKRVISIDRFTGELEHTFLSVSDAARHYKTSSSNISRVCKGTLNYIKDKVFVYEDDFDPSKSYIVHHHMKGIPKSEEFKEKVKHNRRCKPIYKYDAGGNLVTSYISKAEAERLNGYKKDYLKGKLDKVLDGFVYSYKNKDIV